MNFSAFGVSNASAAKGVVEAFGQAGQEAGQFTFAAGSAVNQTTGDVYVADVPIGAGEAGGQRVEQFTADGAFVRAWGWGVATGAGAFEVCTSSCQTGSGGSGDGQFEFALQGETFTHPQIAVDQSDGSVYVADTLNDRVQKFSASGDFLDVLDGGSGSGDGQLNRPQGVAVDPVSGDVYVADTGNNRVQRFTNAGVYASQLGSPAGGSGDGEFLGPRRLAVDSTGRLYVLDDGNGRIQRFTAGGAFDGVFGAASVIPNPALPGFSPSELAVDSADDHVYVSGMTADFSAYAVVELDSAGAVVDVHAPNAGVTFGGLAVESSTGRIYASDLFGQRAVILDDVVAPTVSIDPVSEVTGTSARFNGSVNPQGPPNTGYHFEISPPSSGGGSVPSADVLVGSGMSDVPVSQQVSGLAPNTEYTVRLVATKDFNAGGATSDEVTFTTDAAPPGVRAFGAGNVTNTAAWLGGEVNPRNSPTTAYIEYTVEDDTAYADANRLPLAPDVVDVGAGNGFVTVTQLATGLEPGTGYRFRIVATNPAGTTEGPDRIFTTRQALPKAPEGRGYEMVSPLDKNGGDIDRDLGGPSLTSGASTTGDVVAYASAGRFAGLASGQMGTYRSVRDEQTGWSTRALNPPFETDPLIDANGAGLGYLSGDLSRAVVSTNFPLAPMAPLLSASAGLYLQDNSSGSSSYRLLSIPDHQLLPSSIRSPFGFAAATPDMSHVVFDSRGVQLTDDPLPATHEGVYEWADGQVRFVSELPSGTAAALGKAGAGSSLSSVHPGEHVISDDGQRIFFADGLAAESPLYVRENGSVTRAVSASERDGDDLSQAREARFLAAKADDGSSALFSSFVKLTDDATACDSSCPGGLSNDLYLWDADAPAGERLTDLTTADASGGGVLGIAAVADDLSRVFFVANGDLAEGGADGQPNLYVWSAGDGVRHVTVLSGGDGAVWSTNREVRPVQYRDARLSDDGTQLLFASRGQVTAQDMGGTKQVYLYDDAEGRLECVSCTESVPTGDSWLFFPPDLEANHRTPYRLPRNLSADGGRVFFETAQGLVDRDVNGRADVYMWEDGELSLISTGQAAEESEFVDASASGDDVFFTTRERLVGSDVDEKVDIYDARVGGGFAEQEVPPECVGDECQGSMAVAPKLVDLVGGVGAGDGSVPKRASLTVKPLSVAQRRGLAVGRKVTLVVRVNRAGRVVARGSAHVGGKRRVVLSASRRAGRAGPVRLGLRLSGSARRQLESRGRLRVSLGVRFGGVSRLVSFGLVGASSGGRGR